MASGETKSKLPNGAGFANQDADPRRGPVKLNSPWLKD